MMGGGYDLNQPVLVFELGVDREFTNVAQLRSLLENLKRVTTG